MYNFRHELSHVVSSEGYGQYQTGVSKKDADRFLRRMSLFRPLRYVTLLGNPPLRTGRAIMGYVDGTWWDVRLRRGLTGTVIGRIGQSDAGHM